MSNGVLAQVHLTAGPVGPRTHLVVISPVEGCIILIDILNSWQDLHTGPLTYGIRAIIVGRAKWKSLELPLSSKIVNQKQHRIPGEIAEISATIKGLKDSGMLIPTIPPFSSPIWPMQKADGVWRMTVGYQKFNHVWLQIVTAVPDMVLCVAWAINTFPGTWYAVTELANAFFSSFSPILVCFYLARHTIHLHSLLYLRGVSALQTSVII